MSQPDVISTLYQKIVIINLLNKIVITNLKNEHIMSSKDRIDGLIANLKSIREFIRIKPHLAEELLDDLIESYTVNCDVVLSVLDSLILPKKSKKNRRHINF